MIELNSFFRNKIMAFLIWCAALSYQVRSEAVIKKPFYPLYHLAPFIAWMNDPCGISYYKGEFYFFYQHNPYSSESPGIATWRLAVSKDLFHWQDRGIVLLPNKYYDETGVFTGSALVEKNTLYLYYTGNVNFTGENPYHLQYQALATSINGVNFTKYDKNPIINASRDNPNLRDPYVWKDGKKYYMVLGNSINSRGRVLLYESEDKINWKNVSVLAESNGTLGYMWECPNFFKLGTYYVLLFAPQGVSPQGDRFRNLYQNGYFIGKYNKITHKFTKITDFKEIDHGHDYYAAQTLYVKSRRIAVAWFDMWETNYPEVKYKFKGQMTLPRTLSLSSSFTILQKPVAEVTNARGSLIHKGRSKGNTTVALNNRAGEIQIRAIAKKNFTLLIESQNASVILSYNFKDGTVMLNRGGDDGIRRTQWRPDGLLLKWHIFIDSSSVELFCGEGEVTISSRIFLEGSINVRVDENSDALYMKVNNMKRTLYV